MAVVPFGVHAAVPDHPARALLGAADQVDGLVPEMTDSMWECADVVRALLVLANESQGGKTDDEMPADALIPHSNGYSFWFIKPGPLGTAPLSVEEIAERVERRLTSCGQRVSLNQAPWVKCTLPSGHEGECGVV